MSIFSHLKHFSPGEFSAPNRLDKKLLYLLDAARSGAGVPFYITSDLRPEDTDSAHSLSLAIDFADNLNGDPVSSRWRKRAIIGLEAAGASRYGLYDRHIHIDIDPARDQNVVWIGESS